MQELQGMHENCRLELGLPAKPDLATCLETASAPTVYIFCIQGMADPFQGWGDKSLLSSLCVMPLYSVCFLNSNSHPPGRGRGVECLFFFYCCLALPFLSLLGYQNWSLFSGIERYDTDQLKPTNSRYRKKL